LSNDVITKLKELDVMIIHADKTSLSSPLAKQITLDLKRVNRSSLPTNLIFPADPSKPGIMLPQNIPPNIMLEALEKATAD